MANFISEPITPVAGPRDTAAMSRGEPGLPTAFTWRDVTYAVDVVLESWKESSPEGGRAANEKYLRRHYHELRMSDGAVWTVYFTRHTPKSGSAKQRWFLYETKEEGSNETT